MFGSLLSNVPVGTANLLAYAMLALVAIFLLSGLSFTYYYWRKIKKMKPASPTGSA
jgi:preprotein translocase subunit SecG